MYIYIYAYRTIHLHSYLHAHEDACPMNRQESISRVCYDYRSKGYMNAGVCYWQPPHIHNHIYIYRYGHALNGLGSRPPFCGVGCGGFPPCGVGSGGWESPSLLFPCGVGSCGWKFPSLPLLLWCGVWWVGIPLPPPAVWGL